MARHTSRLLTGHDDTHTHPIVWVTGDPDSDLTVQRTAVPGKVGVVSPVRGSHTCTHTHARDTHSCTRCPHVPLTHSPGHERTKHTLCKLIPPLSNHKSRVVSPKIKEIRYRIAVSPGFKPTRALHQKVQGGWPKEPTILP